MDTYLGKFRRKIGDGKWETWGTQTFLMEPGEVAAFTAKMDTCENVAASTLAQLAEKHQDLYFMWGLLFWDKRWSDGNKSYRYKKYDPPISCRLELGRHDISMADLMRFNSKDVAKYMAEHGRTSMVANAIPSDWR